MVSKSLEKNLSELKASIQSANLGKSRRSMMLKPSESSRNLSSESVAGLRSQSSRKGSPLNAALPVSDGEKLAATDENGATADTAVLVDDKGVASDEDVEDVESSKNRSLQLQVEMLRGKLSRRNMIIEVIRRAYYHDVIIVKEELRHTKLMANSKELPQQQHHEDRLSAVPSVDLRDTLPLFAPAETVLQVHPCEACGGHLELVHGESKELQAARQEMVRASKGEQQMKSVVHRMRTEAKELGEVNEALQQRVKALVKENSYTLEQLQAARKTERGQKTMIANLRSKLQFAHATQEVDRLAAEFKDIKQQLIRSNHDRDIFFASNNHLKEELAEVTKALHQVKVEKAQIESDFGTTYYRLQEEIKKAKQFSDDLASHQVLLKEKTTLSEELQRSLASLKGELVTTLQRFEQTKRHLEDQLIEEERAREEMQEQNLEFRKANKKLVKELEAIQKDPSKLADGTYRAGSKQDGAGGAQHPGGVTTAELKGIMKKKFDDLRCLCEWSQMRENDLLGLLVRQDAARATAAAKPMPVRRMLSRMPSTTVITRYIPNAEAEIARASGTDGGSRENQRAGVKHAKHAGGQQFIGDSDSDNGDGRDAFEEEYAEASGLGVNDKSFEAYHQEVHRTLTEIEEGKDKNQKQRKVIADMERKHQALVNRLEESKLTIEALTGSVNALKMRLNQDSAGAAEELEEMMCRIEDGKRDQLYETEKSRVLKDTLRFISEKVLEFSENQALTGDIDLNFPNFEDDRPVSYGGGMDDNDSHLIPDFQMCRMRSEIINLEIRKLRDTLGRNREDLDEAENKIDSDQLHIRILDAELAKLRLTVEMGKNNLQRTEKALKKATEELQDSQNRFAGQVQELELQKAQLTNLQEDQKMLTMVLFEKTTAWEKEISANDKVCEGAWFGDFLFWCMNVGDSRGQSAVDDCFTRFSSRQGEEACPLLQDIEELAEFRRRTNRSVEISAVPETTESDMQTDRWKPHGLILRQRN
ncbi:hypothetical protein FI667_g11354, partial [Globisporangium splendens]